MGCVESISGKQVSASSSVQFSEPRGEGLDEDIPFRIGCLEFSHSLCNVWLQVSICSYLLQEGACSLMVAEQGMNLCI